MHDSQTLSILTNAGVGTKEMGNRREKEVCVCAHLRHQQVNRDRKPLPGQPPMLLLGRPAEPSQAPPLALPLLLHAPSASNPVQQEPRSFDV